MSAKHQTREERLEELKVRDNVKMIPLGKSIPMATVQKASKRAASTPPPSPAASKKPKKMLRGDLYGWDSVQTSIISWKFKSATKPKLVVEGTRKKASFFLSPFVAANSELGNDGNLRFSNDPNKARFTINLEDGCPKKIEGEMEEYCSKQEKCREFLRLKAKEALEYAYYDDEMWNHISKDNLDTFLKDAYHSWDKESIQLKRRLTSFSGQSNRPTFWKKNINGTYEVLQVDTLPEGSLVKCEAQMNFYAFEDGSMYGSSLELGENIIVIYMPKQEYTDKIPYFDF